MRLVPSSHTVRHVVLEIFIVIIGVLIALAVSDWQQQREAHRFAVQQLQSLTQENDDNLWSLHVVRDRLLPRKLKALQDVIATLSGSAPLHVTDTHAFIETLAESAQTYRLWYQHSRFDALRSTGSFRALGNAKLERELNRAYNGVTVLTSQVDELQSDYPVLVAELIPARYQSRLNPLRGYAGTTSGTAPVVQDPETDAQFLASIERNRSGLLARAHAEVARTTARWYVLARLKDQFMHIRELITAQLAKDNPAPPHDGKAATPAHAHA